MDPIVSDMVVDQEYDEKDVAIITPDDQDTAQMDEIEPELLLRADDFDAIKARHMAELPDLEILDEAHNTWDITGWRDVNRKLHGPVFQCGGFPWRVLFFPFGNACDHTSLYLEQGYGDKTPEDWYACVQFMLVLWNPNDPTIYIQHTATHRFNAEEADWGFTRFAELRKLFTRHEDRDRPMVENNEARITAYVRILKDPTGVLWHNFNNYDSKKETGMVGLKNQGATCYLNSLLQSLYFTTAFRKAVYQIPTENEVDFRTNSAYALQRLFYQMQTSNLAVPTLELTAAFGWDSRQIFEQQDVQELSRVLMERLEERMKGTEAENALAKMFLGKTKTYLNCLNVKYESSRIEDYWDIQLLVAGMKDMDDSFKQYVEAERMDGENKYQTETYGLQDAEKGVTFVTFPPVLHLQLKRFEFDYQRDVMLKINDRHEFPEIWDASPYLAADADKSEPYVYHLHGVLVHSGDLNAGHYYAFIKPQKHGDFYRYDDDKVTRATKKEAMDDNFGGEYPMSNGTTGMRNPYTRQWSTKRSTNAYMLVYIRESRLDEVLCADDDVQPPEHLAKKFAEERAVLERRRKDREEAHLYMEIQVAVGSNFKAHQGTDIVPWKSDDPETAPKSYRLHKSMVMSEFTKYVAEDLDVDPAMIRAWVMVNRQNGTVRPDQPITNPDITVEEAAAKYGTKSASFRLWLETAIKKDDQGQPIWEDSLVDLHGMPNNSASLLFLKHFDVETQQLRGVGSFYAAQQDKVADMAPQILKLMGWPQGTSFKMFEEIKQNMIEPMKPKQTLQASELQHGDIITVQKVLSEKEIAAAQAAGQYTEVREFYDYLLNRIRVRFVPKFGDDDSPEVNFELTLSKKDGYQQWAKKVADHLKGAEWTHLRFSPVSSLNNKAKVPVKHNTTHTLGQTLTPGLNTYGAASNQRSDALFYEVLEFSMAELEMKKTFRVTWLPEGLTKEEHIDILVPKNGTVYDIITTLGRRLDLAPEITSRIRIYEIHGFKIYRDCTPSQPISNLSDYSTLIAEPCPQEEVEPLAEGDSIISAFHFDREPTRPHHLPFSFLVKQGEIFKETKERISRRTGIKGKALDKVRFAVVQRGGYTKPEYLEDDDILSDNLHNRDDMLGLDHPSKTRPITKDQSISIKR